MRPPQLQSAVEFQTVSFFLLDGLANGVDFAFHFWMGRVLIPSDFAILQTLNSVVLIYTTASGVFQPVVGRFVAEARGRAQSDSIEGIFQTFLRAGFWLGIVFATLMLLLSNPIARMLNLPNWTVRIGAGVVFLSTLRPIAVGVLQGREDFLSFGLTRLALSLGRIILVFFLIQAGLGLTGAVWALPFGWFVSLLCAFLLLRKSLWTEHATPKALLREGWRLSFYALLAYVMYMLLTSLDLMWVNRTLEGELAGAYASLVLLRRIVALLPGVAVTVMFPHIAKTLAAGRPPDRLLAQTAGIILAASGALTFLYFIFDDLFITFFFGQAYQAAAPLLGWMGIAMIGVSLSSVWLNYFLAEKPRNFVILLGIAVALEWLLLNLVPRSLQGAVLAFGGTGWLLTLGGLILYQIARLPRTSSSQ
ncbi:MAG TPA: oligosaccharide flippase family protein [Anaerolineales bacterium]|nr:oligosaccharide flippase family protein [Anaerolineales bacterium]